MRRIPRPHLDEHVFLLLRQVQIQSMKLAERQCLAAGVTVAEYALLRIVENTPRVTAGEARKRMLSSAPSVAQLVKRLERKGLIGREQDARDIRRQKITLTAQGRRSIAVARKEIQSALQALKIPGSVLHSLEGHLALISSSLSSYGG
ncbi:MAG: MarR family transcriptional regulator [Patescibacteria group bacterium]